MHFKEKLKSSKLLMSTVISYMSVVLCCVIIMTSVIMIFFIDNIKDQLISSERQNLKSYMDKSENIIRQFNTISYQICFNSKISNPHNFATPTGRNEIIKELAKFAIDSNGFFDLLLYSDNSEYIFTKDTTVTQKTLPTLFQFDNDDFLKDFGSESKFGIYPKTMMNASGVSKEIVPIIFPDTKANFTHKRALLFLVDAQKFLPETGHEDDIFLITEKDGRILTSAGADFGSGTAEFYDGEKRTVNGRKCYGFIESAQNSGLNYILAVPAKYIDGTLYKLLFILILSILIIFAAAGFIVMNSLKYNYKPLNKIKQLIEEQTGVHSDKTDEFAVLEEGINEMASSIRSFTDFKTSNESTVKEVILTKLLQGEYKSTEELNALEQYSGVRLDHGNFCVVSLFFSDKITPELTEIIFRSEIPGEKYFKTGENAHTIQAILCFGADEGVKERAGRLFLDIKKITGATISLGVSSKTDSISQMWRLFMEAVTALDYRFLKGLDSVIYFEDIDSETESVPSYPSALIDSLRIALEQGDVDRGLILIDEIFSFIEKNSFSLFTARCLCFDIINTIIKAVQANSHKSVSRESINIINFETAAQLIDAAKEFCIEELKTIDNENRLFNTAISYIKQNFCENDLSVKSIAEHIGISQSGLYNLFKENLQITPLQYINNLQLERVKELLVTTDLPINTIVSQIGRLDASNFIRKFKTQFGMTPGEYRRLYGNLKDS